MDNYDNDEISSDTSIIRLVGQRLREVRTLRGLSIANLAEKIGVDQEVVVEYENGETRISAETLQTIAQLLNVSVNSFFKTDSTVDSNLYSLRGSQLNGDFELPTDLSTSSLLSHLRSFIKLSNGERQFITKITNLLAISRTLPD